MKLTQIISSLLISATLITTTSCSSESDNDKLKTEITKKSAEDLYQEAKSYTENGRYTKAIKTFEEVERLYPFSNLAPKSRVMTAYAHYKNEDYDKAISVIDSFVAINPGNAEIDFMYYLKSISYYDRISDVKRDQDITKKAKNAFEEVMRRFPASDYAKDSRYKINLIMDHLAGKEMEIGRFYLKNKKYIAALNRFKSVLEDYDKTPQIEEALYRLVETNKILGLHEEAVKHGAILGHNYPEGKWYERAYNLLNGKQMKEESSFFGSWFGGDNDDYTESQDLHSPDDKNRLDRIFQQKIND